MGVDFRRRRRWLLGPVFLLSLTVPAFNRPAAAEPHERRGTPSAQSTTRTG